VREKQCGIYKITNIVNNKVIIGQSSDIYKRWSYYRSMLKQGKYNNDHLQKSWDKYGEGNFQFDIIETGNIETLNEKEILWINKYKSDDPAYGYNLISGGNRPVFSDEVRRKMSESHKGLIRSEEHKMHLSLSNKGKKLSKEHKQKIRESHIGQKRTEEAKKKTSESLRKWHTSHPSLQRGPMPEETKRKISLALIGRQLTTMTDEIRSKISVSQKRRHYLRSVNKSITV